MSTVLCRTKRKLNYKQVATYGLVASVLNALISTEIATNYAAVVKDTNHNHAAYVVPHVGVVHMCIIFL
jgi:hypothetical protein